MPKLMISCKELRLMVSCSDNSVLMIVFCFCTNLQQFVKLCKYVLSYFGNYFSRSLKEPIYLSLKPFQGACLACKPPCHPLYLFCVNQSSKIKTMCNTKKDAAPVTCAGQLLIFNVSFPCRAYHSGSISMNNIL